MSTRERDGWVAYAQEQDRQGVTQTLARAEPGARPLFARSASELRGLLRDEEPRTVRVVVGPCGQGVSDVNLAAAVARDGLAREVVLVARDASGSLRSRAQNAGIARVLEMVEEAPRGEGAGSRGTPGPAIGMPDPAFGSPVLGRDALDPQAAPPQPAAGMPLAPVPAVAGGPGEPLAPVPAVAGGPGEPEGVASPAAPSEEKPGGLVITVVSGRGGVGKTTLCALMGMLAGAWGLSVALLDFDLSCGNLSSLVSPGAASDLARLAGLRPGPGLRAEISRLGISCLEGARIWGPCSRPELAETVMPLATPIIDEVRATNDLVIVDCSTTCTDAVAQAMQAADRLICVQGPGPGGIASLARMSALAVRLGVARTRIVRVEDICDPRLWGRPFEPLVERGLETARAYRVVEGAPDVVELIASGSIRELSALDEDLSRSVATLLACLLQELGSLPEVEDAARAARGAFVRKSFSLFGRRREAV